MTVDYETVDLIQKRLKNIAELKSEQFFNIKESGEFRHLQGYLQAIQDVVEVLENLNK